MGFALEGGTRTNKMEAFPRSRSTPIFDKGQLILQLPRTETDDDSPLGTDCRAPHLFAWKDDLDDFFLSANPKPKKNLTTYVEWKTNPKRRRKKRSGTVDVRAESDETEDSGAKIKEYQSNSRLLKNGNDSAIQPEATGRTPHLLPWKVEVDDYFHEPIQKSRKNATTYVEWKTNPTRRRKKSSNIKLSDDSVNRARYPPRDTREDESTALSKKENNHPPFKHKFSHSRYSNLQKFREMSQHYRTKENLRSQAENLSTYYRQKEKAVNRLSSTEAESLDDLASIKKELADLRQWAKAKKEKSMTKRVQFSYPLITSMKYRPKTKPEDIDALYFREDELQNWEEDRETTSPEQVECMISENALTLQLLITDYRPSSSFD